jgi:hygromycin-B 7''-O-kinase
MLPLCPTPKEYDRLYRRTPLFERAIATLAARHHLPTDPTTQFKSGSNVLFAVGPRHIIKLFAPLFQAEFERERVGIEAMRPAISVAVPELVAQGEFEGWNYLVISRLEGELPRVVWDDVPRRDRLGIAAQMGDMVAAIHAAPAPAALDVDWPNFLVAQLEGATARQREWGAPAAWTQKIVPFVERYGPLAAPGALMLQHADLHDRNVLIRRIKGRWRLSGVLDFGDALVAEKEYDFVQLVLWLFQAEAGLFEAFLHSYGLPPPDPDFARRMMAFAMLHRFTSLKSMRRLARPRRPRDLETLADILFLGKQPPGTGRP